MSFTQETTREDNKLNYFTAVTKNKEKYYMGRLRPRLEALDKCQSVS
jgi:hypothetical protein